MARGTYEYANRLDDFAHVFGRQAVRPIWLPSLNRDVLAPFRDVIPELAQIPMVKERNVRRSWLYVSTVRRLNALKGTAMRRPGIRVRRAMARIDPLAKSVSALENQLNPVDAGTRRGLEEKTELVLRSLRSNYNLR